MRNTLLFICLSVSSQSAFSAVYLYNNTPFPLNAKLIAANGVNLGEKLLEPQETSYIEDQIGTADPVGTGENKPFHNYNESLTPYQVFWYCSKGEEKMYATCTLVGSGATVMATTCAGPCYCDTPKEEQKPKSKDASKDE